MTTITVHNTGTHHHYYNQTKHVASPLTTFTKKINPDSNKIIKQIQSGFTPPTFTKKINPDSNHAKRKIHSGATYDTASPGFASKETQKQYCKVWSNGCNFDGPLMYFKSDDAQNEYCKKHKCMKDPLVGWIVPRSGGVRKELAMLLPGTRFTGFIKNHPMKCYLSKGETVTVKFEINENRQKEFKNRICVNNQREGGLPCSTEEYYYNKFTASGRGGAGCSGTFRMNDLFGLDGAEGGRPWWTHKWVIQGEHEIHCRDAKDEEFSEEAVPIIKRKTRNGNSITYKCDLFSGWGWGKKGDDPSPIR